MRPCPICGTEDTLTHWSYTSYVRCENCTLVYADKLPDLGMLEQIYTENYFSGNTAYRSYESDKAGLQRNFSQRIKTLRRFKPQGDLFEVGCAFGFFLECAQAYWQVRGSDISTIAVQYARNVLNLDVQQSDFEHFDLPPDSFDVIAMWDVIEHLSDPVLAVAKCREALRTNGVIALTTGDIGALVPRLQKHRWRMIIPEHLYFFSKRSLEALFRRYGFEILHFSHPGNYRSLRQLAHILTWQRPETGWRGTVLRLLERTPIAQWGVYLNLYDIMFVVARKK
jgi:SAM-dependent methyltransferase